MKAIVILFFTICVALYIHIGALYSMGVIYSPCLDETPHQTLRASFMAQHKNISLAKDKSPVKSEVLPNPEPAWWMEEEEDDWFERTYHEDEKIYHAVRDLSKLKSHFNPLCGTYRFNITAMPSVSVIMTSQNEVSGWISTTVHSVIARTPPERLKEVIVIDDNGIPPDIRGKDVDEKEYNDLKKLPKLKVIQNHDREGCARSRLIGAKAATGDVLMFIDSHVEMISSTWYQHLVLPIIENPRTMSIQIIDIIDDTGTREYTKVGTSYGLINDDFYFSWQGNRFGDWPAGKTERPGTREPYETPFGPGSLFAMRRDEFWRLGGYDEGLYVWGGENTELALKTWMCGGRIVMVPCSRVGHMFRKSPKLMKKQWPPKIPATLAEKTGCNFPNATDKKSWANKGDFGKITTRNNLRVMNIWVGDHPAKYAYYKKALGSTRLKPEWQQYVDELKTDPAALKQMRLKEENQCRDFEWFDKHVMMKLVGKHHPWYEQVTNAMDAIREDGVSCGQHRAKTCQLCSTTAGWCNGDCAWCEESQQCMSKEETCFREKADRKLLLNDTMAPFSKFKPSKPLPKDRLALLSEPIDLKYVDVSNGNKYHPHKGARDVNGTWGYVHDETALRRNPPPFRFRTMEAACKVQDAHYQMYTRKIVVELEGHNKAEKRGNRDKLMCVVKSSSTRYRQVPYIRETWGQKCDGFLVASNRTIPSYDMVDIAHEGPEAYNNLWQKFRSIVSYLYDIYYHKYDWFFIGDDDTFLIVENLRLYLESEEIKLASNGGIFLPTGNETWQVPLVLGRRFAFKGDRNDIFPSGGAGFVTNKAALKALVVLAIKRFEPHAQVFTDDWYVGRSLRELGIVMYNTQDDRGGERFMPLSAGQHFNASSPDLIVSEYDVWYKNYSLDIKYGLDHCAENAISFHYAKYDELKRFYSLIYGLCPKK